MDDNNSYYENLLNARLEDITTSHSVLILIGAIIGIFGNSAIIGVYWFRIKDGGERYFLPLLAIVDLAACFTSSSFYIMDNTYFFTYPYDTVCRILSFFQFCVPGISAHALLVISVQRYRLVCKPHSPRMSLKCKRICFCGVCIFAFVYSCPLLGISGVEDSTQLFMNHTVRTRICRFSVIESGFMNVYFGILALVMVGNIVVTVVLFIPIMRNIKMVLTRSKFKTKQTPPELSQSSVITSSSYTDNKSSQIDNKEPKSFKSASKFAYPQNHPDGAKLNDIDIDNKEPKTPESAFKLANPQNHPDVDKLDDIDIDNKEPKTSESASKFAYLQKDPECSKLGDIKIDTTSENQRKADKIEENKHKLKVRPVKKRITMMFFVIVLVYVLSYIPSLAILIATYAIEDFAFVSLSDSEAAVWMFFGRFVFINHIANPFICGYFDVKFKKELLKCFYRVCRRQKT